MSDPKIIVGIDPGISGGIVLMAPGREMPGFQDYLEWISFTYFDEKSGIGCVTLQMPTVEVTSKKVKGKVKTKHELCLPALRKILANAYMVFIEKQQAMSQPVPRRCARCGAVVDVTTPQGSVSIFSHGRGYGILEGLVVGLGLKYELVHTLAWQNALTKGLPGDSKSRAAMVAARLFPGLDLRPSVRARKGHEGIIDALLLAEYGRRRLGGEIVEEDDPDGLPF
jgi:hypothetical protein